MCCALSVFSNNYCGKNRPNDARSNIIHCRAWFKRANQTTAASEKMWISCEQDEFLNLSQMSPANFLFLMTNTWTNSLTRTVLHTHDRVKNWIASKTMIKFQHSNVLAAYILWIFKATVCRIVNRENRFVVATNYSHKTHPPNSQNSLERFAISLSNSTTESRTHTHTHTFGFI